jgi:hypothetical protein
VSRASAVVVGFVFVQVSKYTATKFGSWSAASANCTPSSLPNGKQMSSLILDGQWTEADLCGEDL